MRWDRGGVRLPIDRTCENSRDHWNGSLFWGCGGSAEAGVWNRDEFVGKRGVEFISRTALAAVSTLKKPGLTPVG